MISGKGGTGKTSIVASFAALAGRSVLADCDVDAADLQIILEPETKSIETFVGGTVADIAQNNCNGCGLCADLCRFGAVRQEKTAGGAGVKKYSIDESVCEGCGVCAWFCPEQAIELTESSQGEWFVSETRFGPMAHARLRPGGENSGKLVTILRNQAKKLAESSGLHLTICDGSPGIGCPVIASIAGADMALIVTEPTLSGRHDLDRIAQLTKHFGITSAVCINKADINNDVADSIEKEAEHRGIEVLGRISYDKAVTEAQIRRLSAIEYSRSKAAGEIETLWLAVTRKLGLNHSGNSERKQYNHPQQRKQET